MSTVMFVRLQVAYAGRNCCRSPLVSRAGQLSSWQEMLCAAALVFLVDRAILTIQDAIACVGVA